jgi:hypothetical protein
MEQVETLFILLLNNVCDLSNQVELATHKLVVFESIIETNYRKRENRREMAQLKICESL